MDWELGFALKPGMGAFGGQSEDGFLRIKDIKKLPQFFSLAGAFYDIHLTPTKGGSRLGRSHQPLKGILKWTPSLYITILYKKGLVKSIFLILLQSPFSSYLLNGNQP